MKNQKLHFVGIYILLIGIIYFLTEVIIFPNWWWHFYVLAFGLISITVIEILGEIRKKGHRGLISPLFLGGATTFLLSVGGLTSFLLTYEGRFLVFGTSFTVSTLYANPQWLVKGIGYSAIGALFCFLGYRMRIASCLSDAYLKKISFITNCEIPKINLIALFCFAYFVKFYLFSQGLYGYQQLGKGFYEQSRLHVFQSVGTLLLAVATYLFYTQKTKFNKLFFYFVFSFELLFSIVHGARSAIVMFFGVLIVSSIYAGAKLKISQVIGFIGVIILAFTIGGQFKEFYGRIADKTEINTPLKTLEAFMSKKSKIKKKLKDLNEFTEKEMGIKNIVYYLAISRFCYLSETSLSIYHKDTYGLTEKDPSFIKAILLSPIFAFFPSYYLFGKVDPAWGGWFLVDVQKSSTSGYSIAFSPIGYLYFLGKLPAIMLGCLMYGLMLKFTASLMQHRGVFIFIIFMALLSVVQTFDTNVGGTITIFLRYVFGIPIVLFLFFTNYSIKIVIYFLSQIKRDTKF